MKKTLSMIIVVVALLPLAWIFSGCYSNSPCRYQMKEYAAATWAFLGGESANFQISRSSVHGGEVYQAYAVSRNTARYWRCGSWAVDPGDGFSDYFISENGYMYHFSSVTNLTPGWTRGENLDHRFLRASLEDQEHFTMFGAVARDETWEVAMLFVYGGTNPHWFRVHGNWLYFNMQYLNELPPTASIAVNTVGLRFRVSDGLLHRIEYTFCPGDTGWAPPHVRLAFDFSNQVITPPERVEVRPTLQTPTNIRIDGNSVVWEGGAVSSAIVLVYRDGVYIGQTNAFDNHLTFEWAITFGGVTPGVEFELVVIQVDWTGAHSHSARSNVFVLLIESA